MTVPAEAAGDVVAPHGLMARDNILDGPGEDVAVVGKAGGKRGPVIENVVRLTLSELELRVEGVDL